jgi:lipid-binding SYLF domain-containing protein
MQTMTRLPSCSFYCSLVLLLACTAGCGILPERGSTMNAAEMTAAEAALQAFESDERLEPFFAQAKLVAVYPTGIRAGFGIGGGLGHGVVFQGEQVIGRTSMYQVSVGANVGGQVYRQILFFKSKASFERLMDGVMEFAGQANLAVARTGGSATPSFNREVAMFTQLRNGLLIEGSVGAHHYTFRRLITDSAQPTPDEGAKDDPAL